MISRPAVITGLWQILILFTPNITKLSKEICLNNIANVPMDWVWAVKGSQSQIGLLGSKTQSLFSNIPFIVLTVCASFSLAAYVCAFQPLVPTLHSYGSLHSTIWKSTFLQKSCTGSKKWNFQRQREWDRNRKRNKARTVYSSGCFPTPLRFT